MVEEAANGCVLVDFGSGNSVKTRHFIGALLKRRETLTYNPVDISTEFIKEVCDSLQPIYGDTLNLAPIYGDYDTAIDSFSSNIITDNDRLLISLDITQDKGAIFNAYLDPMGHSENLHANAISRLNREYRADLDLSKFKLIEAFHRSLNPEEVSKFTEGWRSIGKQDIEIPGLNLTLHFSDGDFLNLYEKDGVSCTYTMDQIRSLVHRGNHVLCRHWIDKDRHAVFCCLAKTKKRSFIDELSKVDT